MGDADEQTVASMEQPAQSRRRESRARDGVLLRFGFPRKCDRFMNQRPHGRLNRD
jgi:hypothetical protein